MADQDGASAAMNYSFDQIIREEGTSYRKNVVADMIDGQWCGRGRSSQLTPDMPRDHYKVHTQVCVSCSFEFDRVDMFMPGISYISSTYFELEVTFSRSQV